MLALWLSIFTISANVGDEPGLAGPLIVQVDEGKSQDFEPSSTARFLNHYASNLWFVPLRNPIGDRWNHFAIERKFPRQLLLELSTNDEPLHSEFLPLAKIVGHSIVEPFLLEGSPQRVLVGYQQTHFSVKKMISSHLAVYNLESAHRPLEPDWILNFDGLIRDVRRLATPEVPNGFAVLLQSPVGKDTSEAHLFWIDASRGEILARTYAGLEAVHNPIYLFPLVPNSLFLLMGAHTSIARAFELQNGTFIEVQRVPIRGRVIIAEFRKAIVPVVENGVLSFTTALKSPNQPASNCIYRISHIHSPS